MTIFVTALFGYLQYKLLKSQKEIVKSTKEVEKTFKQYVLNAEPGKYETKINDINKIHTDKNGNIRDDKKRSWWQFWK
jgi:hypothetical protein